MSKYSIVVQTDSYKVSHWLQFPPKTERSFYYIESRGGAEDLQFFGLQQVNRDTLKCAMKCSAVKIDGVWIDAFKDPFDAPWKASKAGRLDNADLYTVWINGVFVKEYTFDEVRENAKDNFK